MVWTAPHTFSTGEIVSAPTLNAGTANDAYLFGDVSWITMSGFTNGWVAGGAGETPRYRLVGSMVLATGWITTGTINTIAFTFPVGYRPQITYQVACVSNLAFGVLNVNTAGQLVPQVGNNTYFDLSSLLFSTLP